MWKGTVTEMNFVLVVAVILVGAALFWWLTRIKIVCPDCGSSKVDQISKRVLNVRSMNYAGMEEARSAVQTSYEVTWRCRECDTQWTSMMTETKN